ncbi:OmpH family outer membrane protein [Amaricoccus sp.]|uniref:OmpH family outer membrane protein n=1 Tax=Amaricoccus sp. TaxID=1872485 RepID=UPI001B3DBA3B|nr:OmpH family outer membrane protein [Amaricoccus sp.]MBP7001590.1 OmpH family outer membrane protein [Amaricoccus sp.]
MARTRRAVAASIVALAAAAGAAGAQEAGTAPAPGPAPIPLLPAQSRPAGPSGGPTFLYINQDRILTGSKRGQALLAEEEAARDALRAEARRIEAAFEEEERGLNDKRREMSPPDFRKLADDFDARVVEARRQQDERANALATEFDQKRRQFYAGVGPVLVGLMERRGGLAIFDESSVLLADPSINVTDEVIAEMDRLPPQQPAPSPQQPAPQAEPAPAGTPPARSE